MTVTIFYICAVAILATYLTIVFCKFGIPESISGTYYLWTNRLVRKTAFTLTMTSCSLCITLPWIEISPNNIAFLPFLAGAGMMYVGAACAFLDKLTRTVHFIGAGIWATAAILWFLLMGDIISVALGIILGAAGMMINGLKNHTFWFEMMVVFMEIIGLIKYL